MSINENNENCFYEIRNHFGHECEMNENILEHLTSKFALENNLLPVFIMRRTTSPFSFSSQPHQSHQSQSHQSHQSFGNYNYNLNYNSDDPFNFKSDKTSNQKQKQKQDHPFSFGGWE